MKIKNLIPVLMITFFVSANAAEIFKCKSPKGEMAYQAEPCTPSETPRGVLKTKEMTPQEIEEAKAKLKTEEEEEAAFDAANANAEKQRQMQLQKQQELELEQRRIAAEEKAANAAQRRKDWGPTYMPPYYRNYYGE